MTLFHLPRSVRRVGLLSVVRIWGEVKGHSAINCPRKTRRTISYSHTRPMPHHEPNARAFLPLFSSTELTARAATRLAPVMVKGNSESQRTRPHAQTATHEVSPYRVIPVDPDSKEGGLDIAPSLFFVHVLNRSRSVTVPMNECGLAILGRTRRGGRKRSLTWSLAGFPITSRAQWFTREEVVITATRVSIVNPISSPTFTPSVSSG